MKVRPLEIEDYDNILCKWWKDWRWDAPPRDMLPENGTGGVIVSIDGVDVCAGFIYLTNSKTAWVEFIISNFEYKNKDRHEAIIFLINVLTELAKSKGNKYIYTSLKNTSLISKYEECGFNKGSENCQEMIKVLWQQ